MALKLNNEHDFCPCCESWILSAMKIHLWNSINRYGRDNFFIGQDCSGFPKWFFKQDNDWTAALNEDAA